MSETLDAFSRSMERVYDRLQAGLRARPRDYEWRIEQLRRLKALIEENETAIHAALWSDLRKGPFECQATEQGVIISEISDALKNLKKWMRDERAPTPLYNWPGRSFIRREPLGLTLIIGAWNYPLQLTLAPVVGAIAGGNGAIIKPPDMAPATSRLVADLVPRYLDPDLFAAIEGGKDETGLLLKKKFELIFFTGSVAVAKIVMTAAAENLAPVVLELGGKSPAIVRPDADLRVTAKRLAWGKFMNAGQTCVAPDYVIAPSSIRARLVDEIKRAIKEFYGDDVQTNPDYCRIVNARAFDRLSALTEGLRILAGGKRDRKDLFIEPTVVEARASDEIMQNEIFGPILPILEIDGLDEAIAFVNARPKPLALYLFTADAQTSSAVADRTSSGSLLVNDVVMHMPMPGLPFGGVGQSGMGQYHGRFSFETFTHAKGVLHKRFWFDPPVRYAPYAPLKAKILRWLFS